MVILTDPKARPRDMAQMDHAAFRAELLSGRLRWLFSGLAAVSTGTLVLTFVDPSLSASFPFRASGPTLQVLVALGTGLWILLAALNWRNWVRWKRSHP